MYHVHDQIEWRVLRDCRIKLFFTFFLTFVILALIMLHDIRNNLYFFVWIFNYNWMPNIFVVPGQEALRFDTFFTGMFLYSGEVVRFTRFLAFFETVRFGDFVWRSTQLSGSNRYRRRCRFRNNGSTA